MMIPGLTSLVIAIVNSIVEAENIPSKSRNRSASFSCRSLDDIGQGSEDQEGCYQVGMWVHP